MQIQKLYQPNIVVSNVGFSAFDPLNLKKKSSDGERVTTRGMNRVKSGLVRSVFKTLNICIQFVQMKWANFMDKISNKHLWNEINIVYTYGIKVLFLIMTFFGISILNSEQF